MLSIVKLETQKNDLNRKTGGTKSGGLDVLIDKFTLKFFYKWANPGLFFVYFCLFKLTFQFLQQMDVKKRPSSILRWDSNPQPLEHESPPITTRPGQPFLLKLA